MYFIFIVDSAGMAKKVDAVWHHMVGIEKRVSELEGQAAATELAVRAMADNPLNPATAAAEARDILRILEG